MISTTITDPRIAMAKDRACECKTFCMHAAATLFKEAATPDLAGTDCQVPVFLPNGQFSLVDVNISPSISQDAEVSWISLIKSRSFSGSTEYLKCGLWTYGEDYYSLAMVLHQYFDSTHEAISLTEAITANCASSNHAWQFKSFAKNTDSTSLVLTLWNCLITSFCNYCVPPDQNNNFGLGGVGGGGKRAMRNTVASSPVFNTTQTSSTRHANHVHTNLPSHSHWNKP